MTVLCILENSREDIPSVINQELKQIKKTPVIKETSQACPCIYQHIAHYYDYLQVV